MLHLSVLMENSAADGYAHEHGLSFLLESDGTVILFDAGASAAFLDNAARMGCNLGKVTHIVLSHGHYDHTTGLAQGLRHIAGKRRGSPNPPLIAHPDVLSHRRRESNHPKGPKYLGMPDDSRRELAPWPKILSKNPVRIREDIVFLGQIPHRHPEMCTLVGVVDSKKGGQEKDMIHDDSAIAFLTDEGLVIVAGCSHSGIVNIMEHAKAVTGIPNIRAVYGGLHCQDMKPEIIAKTWAALEAEDMEELYACHCTGNALEGFPNMVRLAAGESRTIIR